MSGAALAAGLLVLAATLLVPDGGALARRRLRAAPPRTGARTGRAGRAGYGGLRRVRKPPGSDPATVLDLVAAALSAGLPPAQAVEVVAAAVPPGDGDRLREVAGRMRVGASTDEVWAGTPGRLAPLRRALTLSARTGAPAAELLTEEAAELRRRRARAAEAAAQRLGVRVVLPLGLCALPGFAAWGVVPVVLGLAADALGG
ncbi:type II secretion system F family protein [Kineosporiaceae bacterium SCSIO 59966]|nr:type II secretion system F family protein [Kineosporiaceae bacterium SCSIO 59966]